MRTLGLRAFSRRGQATIELAVSLPVALVVFVIVVNVMTFLSEASAFDHALPQSVVEVIQSIPIDEAGHDLSAHIRDSVEQRMDLSSRFSVEVAQRGATPRSAGGLHLLGDPVEYAGTLTYRPWPGPGSVRVGGVESGSLFDLKRVRSLTVSTYRPGSL